MFFINMISSLIIILKSFFANSSQMRVNKMFRINMLFPRFHILIGFISLVAIKLVFRFCIGIWYFILQCELLIKILEFLSTCDSILEICCSFALFWIVQAWWFVLSENMSLDMTCLLKFQTSKRTSKLLQCFYLASV